MSTKKTNIIISFIIALVFLVGLFLYPSLPEKMATHWNANGEVDGYMSKFWGTFFMPFLLLFMLGVYLVVPRLEPLRANFEESRKYFNVLMLFLFGFMAYIYGLMLASNLGYEFNFTTFIIPAVALLFFIIGMSVEKIKRNWFMGIRTPWTLSNDVVWEKTHRFGGLLFKIAGVVALLGLFFIGVVAILFIVVPIILVTLLSFLYSYIQYKRLNK